MKTLTYCRQCVMPDSKPFLSFDAQGVCSACRAQGLKRAQRQGIDWDARRAQFEALLQAARARRAPLYDVVVPVSGGKDSIFQVHTALRYGLRVLAVHVDYGIKTDIGRCNLEVVPNMGATLLILRPEQILHNRLIRIGFEDYGDPDLMSHGLLYAFPMWSAIYFEVPVVLWGENSAFEYGGDAASSAKYCIDREWFMRHVMTRGVSVEDIATRYEVPLEALKLYDFPQAELDARGIEGLFLSHFVPWDSEAHLRNAREYGFRGLDQPREGTFRNYVGIDEKINRIHQYMKVLKFGYGRATDHACEEIRQGRMTRSQGVALVRRYDREPLSDDYVDDFIELIRCSRQSFWDTMERYRDRRVWRQVDGRWTLDDRGLDEAGCTGA